MRGPPGVQDEVGACHTDLGVICRHRTSIGLARRGHPRNDSRGRELRTSPWGSATGDRAAGGPGAGLGGESLVGIGSMHFPRVGFSRGI